MTQPEEPDDSAAPAAVGLGAGVVLLANTGLLEPTFRRAAIYILEHNEAGTLGVVLNRPSETAVHNLLPGWSDLAGRPKVIFVGGPVKRDAALCVGLLKIGQDAADGAGLRSVMGRVVMVDLDTDPEAAAERLGAIRVFAGYSGWTVGQLESEVERHDWIVVPGLPSDVMTAPGVDVWAQAIRRQKWPMPLLATHPVDLSRN